MDATRDDDVIPTLDELREALGDAARAAERAHRDGGLFGESDDAKLLRYLASHLPELIADAKLLDCLVDSPTQILVGELPLRAAREHFRAAAHLSGERPR